MEGSLSDDYGAPPESWEVADVEASMSRLMLAASTKKKDPELADPLPPATDSSVLPSISSWDSSPSDKAGEDAISQVDPFLREAIQNPRERLSVLRIEQDVEKFVRDITLQQLEFQQLPTSYLRLAAHRIAQHYSLQSMVLPDNSLPDGSGSRIIVFKTFNTRLPPIRLADIPVDLPSENVGVVKVAIKKRPQKRSQTSGNSSSDSSKGNNSRSVEERKEEYNRARARIFNANNNPGGSFVRPESESRLQDFSQHGASGLPKSKEKSVSTSYIDSERCSSDSFANNTRTAKSRTENELMVRNRPNNKVAILRDRETDRKDPDYDRNHGRYMQRFDPGFGFSGGPYTIQPMFTPAMNYNTEFPQLGVPHRPQISTEHQPRLLPQHLPGSWAGPPDAAGISYGHPEPMMTPFNSNHVGARPSSAFYYRSSPFPSQQVSMMHGHEHGHQPFSQPRQPQPDTNFAFARPQ